MTTMRQRESVLSDIAERRAVDVARELEGRSTSDLDGALVAAPATRDALAPLLRPGLHVIAEIKRRSPSAGRLGTSTDLDIAARARAYEEGGAAIVSVLVEGAHFGGSLADLRAARQATALPVLAKDFVVDDRQIPLLRGAGADLILLLATLHPARRLRRLVERARDVGLEPLVEAHDSRTVDAALASGTRLIGLNNRDLRSLVVDPDRAERLRSLVPDDRLVVGESGVSETRMLRRLRGAGFDAVLIGEALMRAGAEAEAIAARVRAFVAAGRQPSDDQDPAAAGRRPSVKICGVTDANGVIAAIAAGADAIGLNLVPGTRRALSMTEAADLVRVCRLHAGSSRPPCLVAVVADMPVRELAALVEALGVDAIQMHGDEHPDDIKGLSRPVTKALRMPSLPAHPPPEAIEAAAEEVAASAARYRTAGATDPFLIDGGDGSSIGGTGRPVPQVLAAAVARRFPVVLAGGLDAAGVAGTLRAVPAVGVDVASGVERPGQWDDQGRPLKDPFLVRLFTKRARAARQDLPTVPARPEPVDIGLTQPDAAGRWGAKRSFGGRYVPETLMSALLELEEAHATLRHDTGFWAELAELGRSFIGRPTPLARADRLASALEAAAGRSTGHLRLYLKREDLAHTGAHKINNALGQALLGRRLGKRRVIAETGAGQHGVATATACALLDLECVVYMGAEDVRRQAPNVLRMHALGAQVREVASGSATLKDAINEAMRDWVTNVATTHYVLGSAVGPHPYPVLVRDLQRVIGDEAQVQMMRAEGRLPDAVIACVGGGSNAIGLFSRFIGEPRVMLVGVEAAGEGLHGRHAAALAGGAPGVLHGSRSYLLQDADGQVTEAHSISAGLDYPGIGPQLAALHDDGRMGIASATDAEAVEAVSLLARTEGILPALEPAHAIAALGGWLSDRPGLPHLPQDAVVLLGLSGRGDKDLAAIAERDADAHGSV